MLLKISLDGPGASSEALTDLARLANAELANSELPSEQVAADGTYELRIGPAAIATLFNLVTRFLRGRSADFTVVIRDDAGNRAQLDRQTVSDPLQLLSALVLFNPPVGLG